MSKLVATKYKHNKLKTMMIDWYIGKRCNFACSYCADFIHDNYSKHVPFEKMKIFVDKIVARYGTNIHWSLTGGEPTLNPDFMQLLEYLQDKKYQISVCTNGSRTIEYMHKMYELVDNITYSLHFEHITPKIKEFTEKALQLETFRREWNSNIPKDKEGWDIGQIQPKQFIARFMVLPGFNKEIADMTAHFKEFGIQKIEHRVIRPQKDMFVAESKVKTEKGNYKWKTKPSVKDVDAETKVAPDVTNRDDITELYKREERWYSEDDRDVLQKMYENVSEERKWLLGFVEGEDGSVKEESYHYNSLNYEYKTSFKGWTCYAGVTLLKVAPNGDIFIANCFQGGPLANIYTMDDSVQLPLNLWYVKSSDARILWI